MKVKSKSKTSDFNLNDIVVLFNLLLADEYVLYTKIRTVGGDIDRQNFYGLHRVFGDQPITLYTIMNDVTDQAYALGYFALGGMEDFISITQLKKTGKTITDRDQKIRILLISYGDIIRLLKKNSVMVTDRYKTLGTSSFITDLIEKHEKMAELLRKAYPGIDIANYQIK
jgi:starvation-inducible DNA-binding protein